MPATKDNYGHFATLPVPKISDLEKIGEGKYREVYRWENYAMKVLKPHIKKQCGPITMHIPTKIHSRIKYGIEDFNMHEYENYQTMIQKIPEEYRTAFNKIHSHGTLGKNSISISDIIYNSDGTRSKSLFLTDKITDPAFWIMLQNIHDMMFSQEIFLLDIHAKNILVQDGKPVLFDYKRLGTTTYPLQAWLHIKDQKIRCMQRRLDRLEDVYKVQ